MERYGLMVVIPTLTALLLSSLNNFTIFLCVFIRPLRLFPSIALRLPTAYNFTRD